MKKVFILPIGEVKTETLKAISGAIREIGRFEIALGEPLPIPEKTYNARRKQYHVTRILKNLERTIHCTDKFILAVIDEDLYVPELNYVFGEADVVAGIAVIALPRLRQEYCGLDPNNELFLLRTTKEAIHEFGHICGLSHCPDPKCIMHFSNSLIDTDRKGPEPCSLCRRQFEAGCKG